MNGYIRTLEIKNQIVPTSIINILIKFYYLHLKIIYIDEIHYGNKPPTISICQLNEKKK